MANPEVVKALMDRLIVSFEQFADEKVDSDPTGIGLEYIDAIMGVHNFYKAIILDLERRIDDPRFDIRGTAIRTLVEGLER